MASRTQKVLMSSENRNFFEKEDALLCALVRDLENTDSLQANAVAFLSTNIQRIRQSLQEKNKVLQPKQTTKKTSSLKKPPPLSLAESKKREYYF